MKRYRSPLSQLALILPGIIAGFCLPGECRSGDGREPKQPLRAELDESSLTSTLPDEPLGASAQIPAQRSPYDPAERSVNVYLAYPGGSLKNVNAETGLMLSLHNWGGTKAVGTADPEFLATRYNVIAISVDYFQSGDRDHSVPYDCGYLSALDSLRALYFVFNQLEQLGKPFARGRIFATGGSGGGNVALMANKLAPRTFACIIDCSGRGKLSADIAFGLPGGSRLNARYSQDPASPHYLTKDAQEIRFVGHPNHLLKMKALGNICKVVVSHGSTDHVCPIEQAEEMVANMQAAGIDVEPHFITDSDLDGKIFKDTGHGVGDRTLIVDHFASQYLSPASPAALVREGKCDFELGDEEVRYATLNGEYVISYQQGYPVGRFESARDRVAGPRDLALAYDSEVDNMTQSYRLYLPSAYDGWQRLPLFIALHGTGGDQNKYFDHPDYHDGVYKREAEKRGMIVVCPNGRGTTEYRGLGENDVLTVIEQLDRQFLVDRDRIVCSGQSMGGTGTTYLCCRYPDLFAGGAPLGSTYGHPMLVENLRHVPMLYVQGEKDWPVYARTGPILIVRRLRELGYRGRLWMVPGAGHNTMKVTTGDVLDWALKQRRVRHPRRVTFRAYLPIHGRAYWTEIKAIEKIGQFAEIDATLEAGNLITVSLKNAKRIALRPESELLDLSRPIRVVVNGKQAFAGTCSVRQEIRLRMGDSGWTGTTGARQVRARTAFRTHKIGTVTVPPIQPRHWDTSRLVPVDIPQSRTEPAETSMGSWMADAMRDASGADIAIYNRRYYRGLPLRENQSVYLIDLFDWLRPFNDRLSTFEATGKVLLEILEDNLRDPEHEDEFLLQVSGCRYEFDRELAQGERIVKSDIEPDRTYTVVCEYHMLNRGDTCFLAGRIGKLPCKDLDITNVTAAWRKIANSGGRIEGKLDGRVRDVTPKP